jgi:hypothetical protein
MKRERANYRHPSQSGDDARKTVPLRSSIRTLTWGVVRHRHRLPTPTPERSMIPAMDANKKSFAVKGQPHDLAK